MAYYVDFVGLNTFIYEVSGWTALDGDNFPDGFPTQAAGFAVEGHSLAGTDMYVGLNHIGQYTLDNNVLKARPQLGFYKNYDFPLNLPHTQSFFPALMLHRNGPYGWPSWKHTRASQIPLIRKQIKNNIFTHVVEPGPEFTTERGRALRSKYGRIEAFVETPVISRFKPIAIRGSAVKRSERSGEAKNERFEINSSFGNSLVHFNDVKLDKYYGFLDASDEEYDKIKNLYLNDGLDDEKSPMDMFEYIKYTETIYPPQKYTNKKYTRQRTTFSFDWKDDINTRRKIDVDNGFGSTPDQSIWPLDVPHQTAGASFIWGEIGGTAWNVRYGFLQEEFGFGVLQNNYSFGALSVPSVITSNQLDAVIRPAPIYNRKHALIPSASVVSKNGMHIEGVTYGIIATDLSDVENLPSGEAKWDAPEQANKNPFYDSYDDYVQDVRQRGKGHSIIPEFRISNHIPTIQSEGYDKKFSNMFEVTGGHINSHGSDQNNFYKVYSTTDFLKHFEVVREDHKEFVDPMEIKLKCKAIKKFLPYNGFYPCQRTTDMAKQFYSSYSNSVLVASGTATEWLTLEDGADIGIQNLLAPVFAPGVLFNSIKSGVACDYPIITGSNLSIASKKILEDGDNYYLMAANAVTKPEIFDRRIPFKAIVEPQAYLADYALVCNEPHHYANHSSSCVWDGSGDNLYRMMAHNFLAEVPNFFLQGQQFTSIYSEPSNNPKVGNVKENEIYTMRIKMYKTVHSSSAGLFSGSTNVSEFFTPPQYSDDVKENFTMYSRPSAFGPPSKATSSFAIHTTGSNSDLGENYPFTPPYYYGQAWADIKFTADATKKYTINEIIKNSEVKYWRFIHSGSTSGGILVDTPATEVNALYNLNAMQLSASVNLFAMGDVKSVDLLDDATSDKVNVAVDISSAEKARWIIQPHFETPMLNFNHYSGSDSLTLPRFGSGSVPRGMWHQYGRLETDPAKGVFMEVTDIPQNFRMKVSGNVNDKSLKTLCGFKNDRKRLGQVATSKTISEAVVAIPFIEEEGQRKFFNLDPATIRFTKEARSMAGEGPVGQSVLDMVDKMRRFVIPPSFDFVHREDIDPIAMYIFEFKHTLTQQDLADMWQNLPPAIGRSFEEEEVSVSHSLLAHELLGGGKTIINQEKQKGNPLPENIKWMVFKAKQRAETNYYNKVVGEEQTTVAGTNRKDFQSRRLAKQAASILRPEGYDVDLSYNWPYDFFSLVELVSLDAEVTLADTETQRDKDEVYVPKRGKRGVQGLPPRAQERNQQQGETISEEEAQETISSLRPGGFFR